MLVAHRCPMWSGGRSLPDSCCQMGPDTVEWPLALCAAPSVAVQPQVLLCGPWHCCAAPGIAVRPLALLCGHWCCCAAPDVTVRPLVVAGRPLVVAGWPLALLGGPWFCWAVHDTAGQSMVPLGSPWYRWAAWIPTALQHGLVTGAIAALLICLLSQKAFQCAYFFSNIRDGFQCHVPMNSTGLD